MGLTRKIKKAWSFIQRYDVPKSLYWRLKLRLPQCFSLHVCPCSIVSIDKSAKVVMRQGEFVINDSWFATRRRRFVSEFRLDKEATFVCEGDFKLFQGASVYVAPGAKLILHGGWSFLNTNSTLNCFHYIEIGKGCSISDNVCIADSDSHYIDGQREKATAPIVIGDHVWIGKNVTVLKGVTIGSGTVVGAGSVVTKNVPCNTVVAGNPAKPLRTIESWE